MPRLILIFALIVLGGLALWKIVQYMRTRNWDWAGIAFIAGFIALAFWLRYSTGVAGIAG